tara:strand:+ start:10530 stop:12317 length:1788 start_codon:yes stop_codon:yes gene_type:complete
MGAYGGGGGFTPSPNNIPGPTKVGSIVADIHQMTGSVEIDGGLTLNGTPITSGPHTTPGGADTQVQYNNAGAFAGSANLTFDGSNLKTTGSLYISSSAAGSNVPLLRIDHPGSGDDNPILFVTGSGFVGIGVLEPTYHLQVAASNLGAPVGTTRAFQVESDTGGEWFSVNGGSISFGAVGGFAKWGGIDLGQRFNIAPFNATYGALGIGKYPGSTVNIVEVNSANSDQGGDFFVIDSDGNTGIGVTSPTAVLHISSSGTEPLLRVDHSGQSGSAAAPLLYITSSAHVDGEAMIGIGTNAPSRNGIHIKSTTGTGINIEADTHNTPETYDRAAWINMTADGNRIILGTTNQVDLDPFGAYLGGAKPNTAVFGPRSGGVPLHFVTSNKIKTTLDASGHFGVGQGFSNLNYPTAIVHISGSEANVASNSPLLNVEHDANSNILFVTGSGRVGIGTGTPIQTLSVSGSAAFSGSFGSTAIETRSTDLGVLSATDGVSIIDLTAAAINTSFTFSIDNGTFIGQQKSIYVKTIIGATGANSNDAKLQGTNIDSAQALASGQLWLSGSDGGGGFFGWSRGGAVLFWDGTYWAPTSVANLSWN